MNKSNSTTAQPFLSAVAQVGCASALPIHIFRARNRISLEPICELHTRIIAELEILAAEERGALRRSLGIERIEEVNAQIVDGDIARTERKAPDAVDVAVGQGLCAVAAEEGAMRKCQHS